ncbi:hypothetical protein D6D02_07854 [Aureobasidium pullulans]|nr:hypothetical protein D6D02_07854 [Aureobasidium pullulans]THY30819.1 hypothetical protein D6D00_02616 [Aureobasidium pullulans]
MATFSWTLYGIPISCSASHPSRVLLWSHTLMHHPGQFRAAHNSCLAGNLLPRSPSKIATPSGNVKLSSCRKLRYSRPS